MFWCYKVWCRLKNNKVILQKRLELSLDVVSVLSLDLLALSWGLLALSLDLLALSWGLLALSLLTLSWDLLALSLENKTYLICHLPNAVNELKKNRRSVSIGMLVLTMSNSLKQCNVYDIYIAPIIGMLSSKKHWSAYICKEQKPENP